MAVSPVKLAACISVWMAMNSHWHGATRSKPDLPNPGDAFHVAGIVELAGKLGC